MSSAPVLVYVQHLLGIGHLTRAALLSRALADAGTEVHLVSGGMPVADLPLGRARLRQLPAARSADTAFTALVDERGRPVDAAWRSTRRDALLKIFSDCRPRALVVETFPFGRRQMRFELVPLLEAAHELRSRPRVIASVRDILQAKRDPARIAETVDMVRRWFDLVLVHGDPSFVRFEETFPGYRDIAAKVRYTGIVARPPEAYRPCEGGTGCGEVIVSAGGGVVGAALLRAALRARAGSRLRAARWRLLAGPNLDAQAFTALRREAPRGITVERARADFPHLLGGCALSISQAGYNSVADVLGAGVRAVIVPFRGPQETEQTLRATRLAARRAAVVVDEADLDPGRLARAVDAALDGPPASRAGLDLNGAPCSARLIQRLLAARNGALA
ncbi:MAG: glycosyl transferase [Gammaproteobacteria bacterium]|nr:glycosyl transferase [Gammaproteobacteria bacterium]NIR85664.1 glycosyl transferase [Gammaproteobacteria bacterium]NIR90152.1 glycosyl transferase [Gammaproteobacteria bacterium]NIU06798.1 glycosyl transferase [Gammaproteobacteria bacterium]NIV53731.1 glycosyl transferase [Gammaproteobacteria bacterium]